MLNEGNYQCYGPYLSTGGAIGPGYNYGKPTNLANVKFGKRDPVFGFEELLEKHGRHGAKIVLDLSCFGHFLYEKLKV
jgi:hypothetical protein